MAQLYVVRVHIDAQVSPAVLIHMCYNNILKFLWKVNINLINKLIKIIFSLLTEKKNSITSCHFSHVCIMDAQVSQVHVSI